MRCWRPGPVASPVPVVHFRPAASASGVARSRSGCHGLSTGALTVFASGDRAQTWECMNIVRLPRLLQVASPRPRRAGVSNTRSVAAGGARPPLIAGPLHLGQAAAADQGSARRQRQMGAGVSRRPAWHEG